MRPDVWPGRHSRCRRTGPDTLPPTTLAHPRPPPPPPVPRRTDWRQGRRLHSLLLLPASIPPSIKHTSFTLHLHYDGCLSPARLVISSSFTSPGSPLFLHSSAASTVCFLISRVHLPGLLASSLFYILLRGLRFGGRRPTGRLLEDEEEEEEEGVPDILPSHGV